jgi:RHS repeat-associated protein
MLVGPQGGRIDPITGNIYHQQRDLNVRLQRWMQVDPWVYVDGMDPYLPMGANPVGLADPFGLAAAAKLYNVTLSIKPDGLDGMPWTTLAAAERGRPDRPFSNDAFGDTVNDEADVSVVFDLHEDSGCWLLSATVTLSQWVRIDMEDIREAPGGVRGVYGHEQRHVQYAQEAFKAIAAELDGKLTAFNEQNGRNEDMAHLEALKDNLAATREVNAMLKANVGHDQSAVRYGGTLPPVDGASYPPIGTMPLEPSPPPTTRPA